ncbi:hypothetical protein BDV95DRAFT_585620 [Massariosphaeria phaeospora]|uniref:Uncharacterized protein n=1 Tax=Massariosphaeria phaeospora TaxID=100035 RepID=A0A7C8HZ96_9PLEO|nr:hypothetical protein BDV95DRAFT_585620 [Massariosphaeria phaeospora]
MAYLQALPTLAGRHPSPKHHPQPPRPVKNKGGFGDCRDREYRTNRSVCPAETYLQTQQFAPTPNRFSILAELDQSPNQSKFTFDFVQTANTSARRRGKRGGNPDKGATYSLADKKPKDFASQASTLATFGVPQSDFTFSVGGSGQKLFSETQPNARTLPATPEKRHVAQSSKPYLGHGKSMPPPVELPAIKTKESRFFPTPVAPTTPRMLDRSKTCLSIKIPTSAQKAAATAACRALASQKKGPPRSVFDHSTHHWESTSSPPPSLNTSGGNFGRDTDSKFPVVPTAAPVAITHPYAGFSTKTTSTAESHTAIVPSPSIVPGPLSMPDWAPISGLRAPIITSQTTTSNHSRGQIGFPQQEAGPTPTKHILSQPIVLAPNGKPIDSGLPVVPEPSTGPHSCLAGQNKNLNDFLKMGHAKSCWCSSHKSAHSCTSPRPCPLPVAEERTPPAQKVQLAIPDPDMTERLQAEDQLSPTDPDPDLDSISLASFSTSSTCSSFEDLGALTPTSSSTPPSPRPLHADYDYDYDYDWTLVSPTSHLSLYTESTNSPTSTALLTPTSAYPSPPPSPICGSPITAVSGQNDLPGGKTSAWTGARIADKHPQYTAWPTLREAAALHVGRPAKGRGARSES